ncbi:MAG: hypothetical protein RLZZ481_3246 [Pseudomonadota bacterium]|jgi:uncharacterized membrane protein YeiH
MINTQLSLETIMFWVAIIATMAFAVTAVLAIADRGVDIFGVMVLGVITAIGGGTVRDLLLGVQPFWVEDLVFVGVAMLSSLLAFVGRSFFTQPQVFTLMLYLDGLGAALFGIQGAMKTYEMAFGWPLAPIILGVITAIGGGIMRDVIAGRKNLLMSTELYAIPVALGCLLLMTSLHFYPHDAIEILLGCTAVTFLMRAAAIHWGLTVPAFLVTHSKS